MGILANWLLKNNLQDEYNNTGMWIFKGEGEFAPYYGDSFWMSYNIHTKVVDREKFKWVQLLEKDAEEEALSYCRNRVQDVISKYAVLFQQGGNNMLFWEREKDFCPEKMQVQNALRLFQIKKEIINYLNRTLPEFYGLEVTLFHDKKTSREKEKEDTKKTLVPEIVDADFKKIEHYMSAKDKGEINPIDEEELLRILQKFTDPLRLKFLNERQIEKLKQVNTYISEYLRLRGSLGSMRNIELREKLDRDNIDLERQEIRVRGKELEAQEAEARVMKRDALRELSDASTASPPSAGLTEDLKTISTLQLAHKRGEVPEKVRNGEMSQQEADRIINAIDNELSKR